MATPDELILAMSDRIDDTIKTMKDNHQLPKDIELEALSCSLFKSMARLMRIGIHDKETLEMYAISVLNKHFMDIGLDLYIKKYDQPSSGFRQIN